MINTLFASVAFFGIESGNVIRGGDRMFQMVLSDPFQKAATATATVADKSGLIQNIVSNVNQSKILSFLQCIEQFLNRCPSPKSLFNYKVGGIAQAHADIVNGSRTILAQMPCLMSAIAFGQTSPSSHFDLFGSLIKSKNLAFHFGKIATIDVGPAPACPG
jgi:hypothetical protein